MQAIALVGPAMAAAGSSTALAVASTAVGVAGAVAQGRAASAEAQYRAVLASRQAKLEEQNAALVKQSGQQQAMDQDFAAADIMAEELATMAGRGFNVNSTSYQRRRNNQSVLARRDRLRTINDANNQAASSRNRAQTARLEGAQARQAGRNARTETVLNIGSSLISGASLAGDLAARRLQNQSRTVN